jgi:dienelactone hydrolase
MQKTTSILLVVLATLLSSCVTTEKLPPSYTEAPHWLYLEGSNNDVGIILCHGNGGNSDGYVVGRLRTDINKKLGYHTLSIDMPSAGNRKKMPEFYSDFPKAYQSIQAGVDYLQKEKGVKKIFIIGHSMGARMTTAYLAKYPMVDISGFVGAGMLNNGNYPFNCKSNLTKIALPTLDVYGEYGKFDDAYHANNRKNLLSDKYTQVMVPAGDHAFSDSESELSEIVTNWLQEQN